MSNSLRSLQEPGTWTARVAWVAMPFAAGPLLAGALDPRSHCFRTVASLMLWVGWAVALGASLVPRTVSLTGMRVLMAAGVPATAWAALAMADGQPSWQAMVGLAWAALALAASLSPLLGDAFVNGSAYGPERRLPLRIPGSLLLLAPLTWLAALAGTGAGPLLLSAHLWVAGVCAIVIGFPIAYASVRALHGLARRWVVLVPAGLVLHDPLGLPDTILFPRRMIERLGPAGRTSVQDALDTTQRAAGLALLIELNEALPIGRRTGRKEVESVDARRVLFTPTRPGAVLAEARERRLPVGLTGQASASPPPTTSSAS